MNKRNIMTAASLLFSALCLVIFASVVHSADFTFHVPVELNNMDPDFTDGRVECTVCSNAPTCSDIGRNERQFYLAGGNYSGTVEISFNAVPSRKPIEGKHWRCEILLHKGRAVGDVRAMMPSAQYPLDPSKPLKYFTEGLIPQ